MSYREGWKVEVPCPKCGHKMNLATQTIHGEQVEPVYICQFSGEDYEVTLSTGEPVWVRLPACDNRTSPVRLHDIPTGYFRHWRRAHKPTENVPERKYA